MNEKRISKVAKTIARLFAKHGVTPDEAREIVEIFRQAYLIKGLEETLEKN